jgi:hypothetical protein
MSTYTAAVPTGHSQGERIPLANTEDVDRLIELLARPDVHTATIQGPDESMNALDVQVHESFGYMQFAGDELFGYSVGDPQSPDLTELSEAGFPGGSGLPIHQFRAALVEFVTTGGQLPASVQWRDASDVPA